MKPSALLSLLAAGLAAAQNDFLQPWTAGPNKDYSDNPSYSIGTTVRFAWRIDFSNPDLQLWQDNYPGDAQGGPNIVIEDTPPLALESLSGSAYTWVVSYEGLDPSFNHVYYLQLQNGDSTAGSHYFNITAAGTTDDPPPRTTNTSITTTPVSTTPPTSPSTTASPPAATRTVVPEEGGGVSAGATAGIAVGAAAGMFILTAVAWWFWRMKKKKWEETRLTGVAAGPQQYPVQEHFKQYYHEARGNQIHEAPVHERPRYYEADGLPIRE